ncbi:MAG: selenide, water dikinase SelD [Bacillota bacterium]|nr:selenide, water dikinase SelD [Bacillota bacterium]
MGPGDLAQVLCQLPQITDPNVLVGTDTSDDAAVYKLNEETALVCTTDFFSPMVDDAYAFGQIAASNSLSDVYAMGARPLFALNMLAYPAGSLPPDQLAAMLKGSSDKAQEAGIAIIGGHTIDNPEVKYGLAVVGTVHPQKVWTNSQAKPGDVLLLTKPIGSGIITTAHKNGKCPPEVLAGATEAMRKLNKISAETIINTDIKVNACTDVTGFGLIGHLFEIVAGSSLEAHISLSSIPVLEGTRELLESGLVPGGTKRNLEYLEGNLFCEVGITKNDKLLLADAQTSGGLLLSIPEAEAKTAKKLLIAAGVAVAEIGRLYEGKAGIIRVIN